MDFWKELYSATTGLTPLKYATCKEKIKDILSALAPGIATSHRSGLQLTSMRLHPPAAR